MNILRHWIVVGVLLLLCLPGLVFGDLNAFLAKGDFSGGSKTYLEKVQKTPASQEDLFSLGVLQFLGGVEGLIQSFHRYGMGGDSIAGMHVPFLRLPIPPNKNPEKITYDQLRNIFETFYQDMQQVDKTLSRIGAEEFHVSVDFTMIKLDFDGDSKISDDDYFYNVYLAYNWEASWLYESDQPFIITFDRGDAYWLRGYANLLMAFCDVILAFDGQELFDDFGYLFFAKPEKKVMEVSSDGMLQIADIVAFLHSVRLDISDSKRLSRSREHVLKTIELSRLSWDAIINETDDLNEWVPNANQASVTGLSMTEERIAGWSDFLDEASGILEGKTLIPHWRFKDPDKGINLKKTLNGLKHFDLILWVQGSGAIDYMEKGDVSSRETWRRLQNLFQGDFVGFMIWIN